MLLLLGTALFAGCSSSTSPDACASSKVGAHDSLGTPPRSLTAAQRRDQRQYVTRNGSQLRVGGKPWRFSGVNMYWLGLDDFGKGSPQYPTHAEVNNGFCSAQRLGATVVRSTSLGVSVGSPRTFEPALGHFNDKALDSIDYAVADARRYGMRLMIPLTDQWHYYGGGKHTFTNWLGHPDIPGQTVATSAAQQQQEYNFYTDGSVVSAFEAYIKKLLDHVNPLTGMRLGADPTIAIWETGNEVYDAPTSWTEEIAAYIKSLAPHALVADGSASTGKDITQTAVDQSDVDVVDGHFYPTNVAKMRSDAAYVAGQSKAYVVGEYPLTGHDPGAWLSALAADRNVDGDLAWSLLPYSGSGQAVPHHDGYTFHFPGATSKQKRIASLLRAHARDLNRRALQ